MKKKIKWFFMHHEYWIFLVAAFLFVFMAVGNLLFDWATFKVADLQRIAWGIITVSVIGTVAWVWMKFFPYRDHIDPEKVNGFNTEELTEWQKSQIKMFKVGVALAFYALLFWAGIYSVSHL